ncbi:PREDICTED: MBT domain-containing protein 1-like isoform X2 [Branchiostoma belcheri]|uniref:MBT domain-containing protein 1-like isoform X2 n=1 Tax=Branchiostoma belcheri TaxID=7741 RepID=A0A6P4Z6C8_BRABE|nr:PREDICTED: MBT domain-containing protein 1-like isoform X2 [Branchiostoma belcheri]
MDGSFPHMKLEDDDDDGMGNSNDSYAMMDAYDSLGEGSSSPSESDGEDEDDSRDMDYGSDTGLGLDVNAAVIPSTVRCDRCGKEGVRHAFYGKEKRYCSVACSRNAHSSKPAVPKVKKDSLGVKSEKKSVPPPPIPSTVNGSKNKLGPFDWGVHVDTERKESAPVTSFKHAPMSGHWSDVAVGMKVEVLNTDCDLPSKVFWIAQVIKIAGYRAKLRYEGFEENSSLDFWCNLCTMEVHPVGWCATIGKPLVPPKTIQHKYTNWKGFLVKRLTGAKTLPGDFYTKVVESRECKFRSGMQLEVVDKCSISSMRVAVVDEVVGGRIRLLYRDSQDEEDDFWCHMASPLIHPVGWSQLVGHKLTATAEYKAASYAKTISKKLDPMDCPPDLFRKEKTVDSSHQQFHVGMKLEAIDPLNLSTVCVATVRKVLREGYLMIGIDGMETPDGSDWFCYHQTSANIFPVGFCDLNKIELTPPRSYSAPFKWLDYLKKTKSQAAPVKLFNNEIPNHGFKAGMKVEAVDLMEPHLVCVATVVRVVGRLLRVHFDGWEDTYDQWVDCEAPDLYPVGWCEMMGYPLQPPLIKASPPTKTDTSKKRKSKKQTSFGTRKKKKQTSKKVTLKVDSSAPQSDYYHPLEDEAPPHVNLPAHAVAAAIPPVKDPDAEEKDEKPRFDDLDATMQQAISSTAALKDEPLDEGYDVTTPAAPALQSLPNSRIDESSQDGSLQQAAVGSASIPARQGLQGLKTQANLRGNASENHRLLGSSKTDMKVHHNSSSSNTWSGTDFAGRNKEQTGNGSVSQVSAVSVGIKSEEQQPRPDQTGSLPKQMVQTEVKKTPQVITL